MMDVESKDPWLLSPKVVWGSRGGLWIADCGLWTGGEVVMDRSSLLVADYYGVCCVMCI